LEPQWSKAAADLYAKSFSDEWVAERLRVEDGIEVTADAIRGELERIGARRRPAPAVLPYAHDGLAPKLTEARRRRIDRECEVRRREGDSDNEVYDWRCDQLDRFRPAEHLCFNDDPLFNSREMVEAMIRRLKKFHAAVGRPLAGEAFEDVLAAAWRDVGHNVYLSPRNHEGPDVHISLQNQWVAVSMKSEARRQPRPDLQITSLAPHHQELGSPADCVAAVRDAINHLSRYERMIYLRVTREWFPSGESIGLRYTLLDLPKNDIAARLQGITASDFEVDDFSSKNTYSVDVRGDNGERLFRVSVSRRPPRVAIVSLAFGYSDLVTSYWVQEPTSVERIDEAI
jgi:hypothetical protein